MTWLLKLYPRRWRQLKCAGYRPKVTNADTAKSVAIMIGGSMALTLVWMWARVNVGSTYIDSLSPLAFFIPLIVTQRYTSLKGRTAGVQAIFMIASS